MLHLGVESAFEQLHTIRHRDEIDPIPKAIGTFIMGTRSSDKLPEALHHSITAMLRLFSERSERDVCGAAIPYLLGPNGAYLCGYGYSVSDPITPDLTRGDLIPHGTAPAGGFGLSFTVFDHERGILVYWLQRPGFIGFKDPAVQFIRGVRPASRLLMLTGQRADSRDVCATRKYPLPSVP